MRQPAPGVYQFLDDDDGFVNWCLGNPHGKVLNCGRDTQGQVTTLEKLHSATRNGKLCPHFRNSRYPSGIQPNLTTTDYTKICSLTEDALALWARHCGLGSLPAHCRNCEP